MYPLNFSFGKTYALFMVDSWPYNSFLSQDTVEWETGCFDWQVCCFSTALVNSFCIYLINNNNRLLILCLCRFDGRALLDFIRDSSFRRVQEKSEEEEELDEFVNFERYRDLIKHRRRGCRYFFISWQQVWFL
jgi:hypothetical protein